MTNEYARPHRQTKPGRRNGGNALLAIFVVIVILGIVVSSFRSCSSHPASESPSTNPAPATHAPVDSTSPVPVANDQYLPPKMAPATIAKVYENLGYIVRKNTEKDQGTMWSCSNEIGGLAWEINILGTIDEKHTRSIYIDVQVRGQTPIQNAENMMKTQATLPFTGPQAQEVKAWIGKHYYSKEAKTIIGGIPYEFSAPNQYSRMLTIGKEE